LWYQIQMNRIYHSNPEIDDPTRNAQYIGRTVFEKIGSKMLVSALIYYQGADDSTVFRQAALQSFQRE